MHNVRVNPINQDIKPNDSLSKHAHDALGFVFKDCVPIKIWFLFTLNICNLIWKAINSASLIRWKSIYYDLSKISLHEQLFDTVITNNYGHAALIVIVKYCRFSAIGRPDWRGVCWHVCSFKRNSRRHSHDGRKCSLNHQTLIWVIRLFKK